jgi:hypothetical protein
MEIAEIISTDGEIFTKENLSDRALQLHLLKQIDFNIIQEFYFNKLIVSVTREKETKSNGSNGCTPINILEKFKWNFIEPYVNELISKGYLIKKQSINSEMYFTKQKTKTK